MKPALPGVGGHGDEWEQPTRLGKGMVSSAGRLLAHRETGPNRYQWLDTLIAPIPNRRGDG
jgi:hypothetical protein